MHMRWCGFELCQQRRQARTWITEFFCAGFVFGATRELPIERAFKISGKFITQHQ